MEMELRVRHSPLLPFISSIPQWLCKFGADKQSPRTANSPKLMRADMQKKGKWVTGHTPGHTRILSALYTVNNFRHEFKKHLQSTKPLTAKLYFILFYFIYFCHRVMRIACISRSVHTQYPLENKGLTNHALLAQQIQLPFRARSPSLFCLLICLALSLSLPLALSC